MLAIQIIRAHGRIDLFKKVLNYLMESMIKLGQAFLELDGVGVDSFIVGFVIMGLNKIRTKINLDVPSRIPKKHKEKVSMKKKI